MKCPKCDNRKNFTILFSKHHSAYYSGEVEYDSEGQAIMNVLEDRHYVTLDEHMLADGDVFCYDCSFKGTTKDFDDGALPYPVSRTITLNPVEQEVVDLALRKLSRNDFISDDEDTHQHELANTLEPLSDYLSTLFDY